MSTTLFPLLGIIFAFVVAANFAMSHGEDWNPGYFVGVLMLAAMIGVALARAWPRGCFD
jgi:hypothetical protein